MAELEEPEDTFNTDSHDREEDDAPREHDTNISDLELFDSLITAIETEPIETSFVEASDEEYFTNNLSVSMQSKSDTRKLHEQDFRSGGEA